MTGPTPSAAGRPRPPESAAPEPAASLQARFGRIDIYLFDLLLRGLLTRDMRVLDAGCGAGRNLPFLLEEGFDVHALDRSEESLRAVRALFVERTGRPPRVGRIARGVVEALPWPDGRFDAVLSSAVLHFARDADHFGAMVAEMGRVLRPGGLLWARLASSIGIEDRIRTLGDGRYRLPDGSDRFLVDEAMLTSWSARLGGRLVDPIKTTHVQGLRCMTTWVVRVGERAAGV
ncbi:MAG: class I SAM-dependent methyltransferase [Gemmatimonadetes bacterium]|nr:MAG: class I SAM-dependent methyltransferase [Gemmatimonadota bacterium]